MHSQDPKKSSQSNEKPLVSILLPVYNQKEAITKTLKSVLNQTYQHFEIFILDDASTDGSDEIIHAFIAQLPPLEQEKIRYIRNEKNVKLQKNLNNGIKRAQGSLIARIDGDDRWMLERKLELQVEYLLSHPECGLVGGGVVEERIDGTRIEYLKPESDAAIRSTMLIENPFWHGSVVFRKNALEHLSYDQSLTRTEDYELWCRIGKHWKMYNFPLIFLARHDFMRDKNRAAQIREVLEQLTIIFHYRSSYPNFVEGVFRRFFSLLVTPIPVPLRRALARTVQPPWSRAVKISQQQVYQKSPLMILHLVNQSHFGGTQEYILSLASHQSQKGYTPIIATGGAIDPAFTDAIASIPNAQFRHLPHVSPRINLVNELLAIREIRTLVDKIHPHIIHVHSPKLNLLAALAVAHQSIPLIHTIHGFWLNEKVSAFKHFLHYVIEKLALLKMDAVIGVSEKDIQDAVNTGVLPPLVHRAAIHIALNPLTTTFLSKESARKVIEQKISTPLNGKKIIGVISNPYPSKGISHYVQAFAKADLPNSTSVIIGSGPTEEKLRKEINQHNLSSRIFMTGYIPQADKLMNAFDLVVLPSEKEGLPTVLLEAAAAGIPVVATTVGGIPEIVQKNWILVPPKDINALAQALKRGLSLPKLPQKSKEELETEYKEFLRKTDEVYEKVSFKPNTATFNAPDAKHQQSLPAYTNRQ